PPHLEIMQSVPNPNFFGASKGAAVAEVFVRIAIGICISLAFFGCVSQPLKPVPSSLKISEAPEISDIDKEGIRATIRSHLSEIRKCYEDRIRTVGDLYGKLVLQWDIDVGGKVIEGNVSQHLDEIVDNCILAHLKTWTFPEPPKGKVGRVSYPFVFTGK